MSEVGPYCLDCISPARCRHVGQCRATIGLEPTKLSQGHKADTGKQRYDLLSPHSLAGLVQVLTFGAQKYADRNWERGINYSRVFGALLRHAFAWFRGERCDPETGFNHMHHVQACAHFLAHYEELMSTYQKYNDLPAYAAQSQLPLDWATQPPGDRK